MSTTDLSGQDIAIIPCGADKAPSAAPAADLYTGSMFRHALAAALDLVGGDRCRVFILSALHGLVALDTVIAPYNVKMGDPQSVTPERVAEQMSELGLTEATLYCFLPRAYFATLDAAARTHFNWAQDVYEADAGIGYQRGTLSSVRRVYNDPAVDALIARFEAEIAAAA